ncbi:hypothetical protein EZS27_006956 [termite gut metagenome]|uniref:Uncharacterized protein n=1 Tax=termite gut metagenome TaxID=433724 RepID=A0A5J4SJJ0_9ZZZZ
MTHAIAVTTTHITAINNHVLSFHFTLFFNTRHPHGQRGSCYPSIFNLTYTNTYGVGGADGVETTCDCEIPSL